MMKRVYLHAYAYLCKTHTAVVREYHMRQCACFFSSIPERYINSYSYDNPCSMQATANLWLLISKSGLLSVITLNFDPNR